MPARLGRKTDRPKKAADNAHIVIAPLKVVRMHAV
jgi:hypothetical protein